MTSTPELDTATAVLAFARKEKQAAQRAEANVMVAALAWAEQHPVESIIEAATWRGGECGIAIAGPGAPLVAEFCIPEFAAAIGVSTDAGRALIGHAVELAHRLPKTWARVTSGELPAWKARRIAEHSIGLPAAGAAFVDDQLAPFAHKTGPAVVERLVVEAVARFDPDRAATEARAAWDGRHVSFHHDQLSATGTTRIEGELDLADALDLDQALSDGAEQLRLAGSSAPLDVRRSMAVGLLARGQDTLEYERDVVLYVHLTEDQLTARVEHGQRTVTVDQVRTWCQRTGSKVTVKPVIDLHETLSTEAYVVPGRIAEHVHLRDRTCVFPWCTRPARSCESDHVIAHAHGAHRRGGATSTDNLAPLCKRHHRLKTHSTWRYSMIEPGIFLWAAPHGGHYLRDHTGTTET